mgnify:CR=1 FL=1
MDKIRRNKQGRMLHTRFLMYNKKKSGYAFPMKISLGMDIILPPLEMLHMHIMISFFFFSLFVTILKVQMVRKDLKQKQPWTQGKNNLS